MHSREVIAQGAKSEQLIYRRLNIAPLAVDGIVGPKTLSARARFAHLYPNGIDVPDFVQTSKRTTFNGSQPRNVKHVVIHTMESPEQLDMAERCASYFKNSGVNASAHYCVDGDSVVQCVCETDIAWHAPGVQSTSIGIELAGRAKKSREEWLSHESINTIVIAANLVSEVCRRNNVPIKVLDAMQLASGECGIVGHVVVNAAFNGGKGHWDPGPCFPWDVFVQQIELAGVL